MPFDGASNPVAEALLKLQEELELYGEDGWVKEHWHIQSLSKNQFCILGRLLDSQGFIADNGIDGDFELNSTCAEAIAILGRAAGYSNNSVEGAASVVMGFNDEECTIFDDVKALVARAISLVFAKGV